MRLLEKADRQPPQQNRYVVPSWSNLCFALSGFTSIPQTGSRGWTFISLLYVVDEEDGRQEYRRQSGPGGTF